MVTYKCLQNLDFSEESVPVLNLRLGNGLHSSLLPSVFMGGSGNNSVSAFTEFLFKRRKVSK